MRRGRGARDEVARRVSDATGAARPVSDRVRRIFNTGQVVVVCFPTGRAVVHDSGGDGRRMRLLAGKAGGQLGGSAQGDGDVPHSGQRPGVARRS